MLGAVFEDFCDAEKLRLVVLDDTGVGRNADFTVGESVKCLEGLIGIDAGGEVDVYLDVLRGAILES